MKQGWQKVTKVHLLVLEPSAFIRDRDTVAKRLLEPDNGDGKNISAWNSSDLLWVVRTAGYAGSWHWSRRIFFCCNYVCGLKVNLVKGARILLARNKQL